MLWDAGLVLVVGVCAGIVLDLFARPVIPTSRPVAALALCGLTWAGGDLLLHRASGPEEILWARRLLFAGVCALGPCMLVTALRLGGRLPGGAVRVALGLAMAFELVAYGSLFTSRSDLFIAGAPSDPVRGPLFAVHALLQWSLIAVAIALFAASSAKLRGPGRLRGAMVVAGAGFPVVLNIVYVLLGVPELDPTPLAMGVGALSIRWGVPHLVGAPYLATLARSELVDQLHSGVFVADRRGRVLEASRGARGLLPRIEPVGAFLGDLLAAFSNDSGYDVHRFPLVRHGRKVGMGAVVNDRRTRRALEQNAEVASRMEALGVLTSGMAHEINNPLSSVLGAAELLAESLEQDGVDLEGTETGRLLRTVEEGGDRIAEVVRRMRLLSSTRDDETGRAEVCAVAEHAIALACLGKSRDRVRLMRPADPVFAEVRPSDLLQILLHAIGNALESSADSASPVHVLVDRDEDLVDVRILDRGPGIPNGDPSVLFHPFYTTKKPGRGLGLGLSLCWELARKNGGRMHAHPRVGGGAEIRLVLGVAEHVV